MRNYKFRLDKILISKENFKMHPSGVESSLKKGTILIINCKITK